jgi:hypothetical protein
MKNLNKGGYEKLTIKEVRAINNVLNGIIIDLDSLNWNYNLMQDILEGISENKAIDGSVLFKKLFFSSDKEILEVLINNDVYWGIENVDSYKLLNKISPKEKLNEVSTSEFFSDHALKHNPDKMSYVEFLMVSQTMKHDTIISLGDSFDENNIVKWSANNYNINTVLGKLDSIPQTTQFQDLHRAKEFIFI